MPVEEMKLPDISAKKEVRDLIARALKEDIGSGDVTSIALVSRGASSEAVIIAKSNYVVSGTTVARDVFRQVDGSLKCRIIIPDGNRLKRDDVIMRISGRVRSILTAERTALNFMQRMTGIATLTSEFVRKTRPYGVMILDTRKTTPTLRCLEKYAVLCGGGSNHRMGLYDRVLIKDNHRKLWTTTGKRGLDIAVSEARHKYPGTEIEVEVETLGELITVLDAKPDWVLLDNMAPRQLKECVTNCAGRTKLEASGGISMKNVEAVAATGVDAISLGCLTHSAPAADLSLELD